jgi:hypothetical protein
MSGFSRFIEAKKERRQKGQTFSFLFSFLSLMKQISQAIGMALRAG